MVPFVAADMWSRHVLVQVSFHENNHFVDISLLKRGATICRYVLYESIFV